MEEVYRSLAGKRGKLEVVKEGPEGFDVGDGQER